MLCRDEAQKLWACKPELEKLGVGLVCVVHEWIQREVGVCVRVWEGKGVGEEGRKRDDEVSSGVGRV